MMISDEITEKGGDLPSFKYQEIDVVRFLALEDRIGTRPPHITKQRSAKNLVSFGRGKMMMRESTRRYR